MIVISDTTPIISLFKIGRLELLETLFENVIIPQGVYDELTTNTLYKEESKRVEECPFIKLVKVENEKAINLFRNSTGLDKGESEAIILSEEMSADVLLMDEHKGRRVARQMGINITGTVGILIKSYKENILTRREAIECMDVLKDVGIRISNSLYESALNRLKRDS